MTAEVPSEFKTPTEAPGSASIHLFHYGKRGEIGSLYVSEWNIAFYLSLYPVHSVRDLRVTLTNSASYLS